MPGRRGNAAIDTSLCRRCQINEPALTVRNEPLCKGCFSKYVSTKVVKRMESFRVRNSTPGDEPTLLLPLSFGAGSTALLHLLSEHLKGQAEKTGRTGFSLLVLHVDHGQSPVDASVLLDKVKSRYPDHTYLSSKLSDILSYEDASPLLENEKQYLSSEDGEKLDSERFQSLLNSLNSATSRTDAIQILQRRLTVNLAKAHKCDAVLWGDSTTRLAERTLAETAKGRGFSLPWIVADGESPFGIQFYFPMRELLSKEIDSFASLVDPALDDLTIEETTKPAVSTKNTTIDDLMKQYFESVERDYPSIVANVVKTAGKLQPVSLTEVEMQCELCEMPLLENAPEKSRLCYGCVRTLPRVSG